MIRKLISCIPNTITCLNLISGAAGCVLAMLYDTQLGALAACQWAFICIAAAAVFDFLDGASARLLGAYSDIGKELDSLADLISFGLTPAILVYSTVNYYHPGFTAWSLAALMIVVMGALRLAKFNVDTRQTTSFLGLPIPANALFWIGFIAWIQGHTYPGDIAVTVIIVLESLLMVSNMPMFSLKFKNFDWRENFRRYVIILAAILFVVTEGVAGLAWTILLYILISAVGARRREA